MLNYLSFAERCRARLVIGVTMVAGSAASAASINFVNIPDAERTNFTSFTNLPETTVNSELYSGLPYTENGITVKQVNGDANGIYIHPGATGLDGPNDGRFGPKAWYPDGGDLGYTEITRSNGSDFANIGFLTWNGTFSPATLLYELLNDGVVVLAGRIAQTNRVTQYIGFSDGGFDTVRIRDTTDALAPFLGGTTGQRFNALGIDAIELSGTAAVPLPSSFAGGVTLVGLAVLRRRR